MRLAGTKLAANHQYRGFGDQLYDLSGQIPSLDLNFANTKSLVDTTTGQNLVTFTRASSGTYVDGQGVIRTATTNESRFDHNPTTGESLGLLVEEQRTNNVLQSEDFATTWTTSNLTVTTNSVVAPDGTTTADTIAPPTDGLTVSRLLRQNPALTTQQAYTLSVFAKIGTATTNGIALYVSDSTATNNFRSSFNLFALTTSAAGNGWATPAATIVPYPNGWYRCILSGVTSTAHTGLRAVIYLNAAGTVADTYGSIHLWGAQLEAGAFPTSYIPTTTATVTRSADVASITGTNFSSWYRQDEGTVFSEFSAATYSTASYAISDGTNSNRILVDRGSTGTRYVITNAGVGQSGGAQTPYTLNSFAKTSLGYALDNCNLAVGGVLQTLDTSATIPSTTDRLLLGVNAGGAGYGNGPIKRFTFWPRRLSDPTLQGITQ